MDGHGGTASGTASGGSTKVGRRPTFVLPMLPPATAPVSLPAAPLTWRHHFLGNARVAYPVVISQLGHIAVTVADSIVVGRLGELPLAGVALATSVFVVVMVAGLGISMGLTPLVAAAAARNRTNRLALLLGSGLAVCAAAGVVLAALGWAATWVLPHLGEPPAVVALAAPFLRVLSLSMVPLMLFQALRQYAEGMALTRQAMLISLGANLLNIALNYVLVFGWLGGPALGMIGSAYATLLARGLMLGAMAAWFWRAARFAPVRARLAARAKYARRMLGLGLPIAGQMLLETGAFVFSALMMGWLGATALAAHQIAINVASVTYMAASGIGAAATVRVGQLAGGGLRAEGRRAAIAALWLAFGFMLLMGLGLILSRHGLPWLYQPKPAEGGAARLLAAELLIIAALFQVSDGVQVAALGALRGVEDVRVPGLISFVAYWVVALPLGYWLAFRAGLGPMGLWAGLCLGLTVSAVALSWRVVRRM